MLSSQRPTCPSLASRDVPPSPIEALLLKHPWLVPKLYSGRIPSVGTIPRQSC